MPCQITQSLIWRDTPFSPRLVRPALRWIGVSNHNRLVAFALTTPRRLNRRTRALASPTMCRFSPSRSVPELNSLLGSSMCTDRNMAEHVLMDAIVLGLCRGVIDCGNGGVYGNDIEPIACRSATIASHTAW
jgi:hypothetical protein